MPWQGLAHQHPSQHAEAVHVVAGNNAGMLHVWAASGSGQNTWQLVGIQQQVKTLPCICQDVTQKFGFF